MMTAGDVTEPPVDLEEERTPQMTHHLCNCRLTVTWNAVAGPAIRLGLGFVLTGSLSTAAATQDDTDAIARFATLVDERWQDLDDHGRHEFSTALMIALATSGRTDAAQDRGADLYASMPGLFWSLGTPEEPGALGAAVKVLSVRTGQHHGIVYLHNASERRIVLDALLFDLGAASVSYSYAGPGNALPTRNILDVSGFSTPRIAGEPTLEMAAGQGAVLQSVYFQPAPDEIAVLADLARRHLPDDEWAHHYVGTYEQRLSRLTVTSGTAQWGDRRLTNVALADVYAAAALTSRRPSPPVPLPPETSIRDLERGVRLVGEGDYERAADILETVTITLEGQPAQLGDLARAYQYLGIARLYAAGDEDAAIRTFQEALRRDPQLNPEDMLSMRLLRLWNTATQRHAAAVAERRRLIEELRLWEDRARGQADVAELRERLRPGRIFRDCAERCPEMVVVGGGTFRMGSTDGDDDDEQPVREVSMGTFAIGRYEVTYQEWEACASNGGCGGNPRPNDQGWGRERRPVINVTWEDAQEYVRWLSAETGRSYRLPSEAEWEYAARARTTTSRYWGDDENRQCRYANGADITIRQRIRQIPSIVDCADGHVYTAPVGSYLPNPFALYDILGNVWEWVEDCWHSTYAGAPSDGAVWTRGGDCDNHVLRGGSWIDDPPQLRSAKRLRRGSYLGSYHDNYGFRVARSLD